MQEEIMSIRSITRAPLTLAVAFALALSAGDAAMADAQEKTTMKLFKVVTPKDDVVIGLADEELRSFGPAADLDNLAQHLATAGEMTVWQYAVKKDTDGSLVQAPLRRVAIFKAETMRIEPYNPAPLKIASPAP
jgi:hypothetical protein